MIRVGLVIAWVSASLVLGSNVGLSVYGLFVVVYGAAAISLAWITMLFIAWYRKKRLKRWWLEPAALALIAVGVFGEAGFALRFAISKPALRRYVTHVQSTPPPHFGKIQVGLFTVQETEVLDGGTVRLITNECMFDQCGIVFSSGGLPERIGEDTYWRAGDRWWCWQRSW